MRIPSLLALALLVFPVCLSAQAPAATLPFNPQDGETVVFLGDSITHQCLYTQYLEDFFITRYPQRKIKFHNAGISGDRAADAVARFEDDVAAHKPNYVTVLLGMNDGEYQDFNAETFAAYERDMKALLERIRGIGAKPILFSPTMFDYPTHERRLNDETYRFRDRPQVPQYNAVLGYYTGWGLEESLRQQIPFVNLWGPMNTMVAEQRRQKPDFTLVADAIHPSPSGQVLMAYEVLQQLGAERRNVWSVNVGLRGKQPTGGGAGVKVTDIAASEDAGGVKFTVTPNALPWVVPVNHSTEETKWADPADARLGFSLTKAGHRLSGQVLKVTGLAPGNYEVLIDGQPIGKWNHITLGTKIEIQENEASSQFQQALAVSELNRERNDKAVRPLRNTWAQVKGLRKKHAADPAAFEAAYTALKPQLAALKAQADDDLAKVYAAAQPEAFQVEIRPVAAVVK